MKGFYPKILKQAYSLTKDHKIFWVAGLFLVWPNFARAVVWVMVFMFFLNMNLSYQPDGVQEGNMWVGLFSIFAISLFVAYFYRSRAVVNIAVHKLKDQSQIEKAKIYQEADPHTWELMKFGITASVGLIMLIAFLTSPVMYLSAHNFSNRALMLGLFGFGVFLPIFTVIYYSMVFVPMFVTIHHMTTAEAFRIAFDLVKRNWVLLVLMSFILLGIELLVVLCGVLVIYLVSYGFVILSQIFYDVGGSGTINIGQVLVATLGFLVIFTSQAIVAAFQRVVWAILFFEIVKPVKTEEVIETAPVPEVISQ